MQGKAAIFSMNILAEIAMADFCFQNPPGFREGRVFQPL
jgi:hypothetical protein